MDSSSREACPRLRREGLMSVRKRFEFIEKMDAMESAAEEKALLDVID